MTGMPASLAFWIDGRTALVSCARTIRTLAPFEIMVSMSVACCSLLRLASASMYVPPPSSTVFWMSGLSCAAQRGCWKLFHDTPTVHAAALAARAGSAALGAALSGAALAGALDDPLDEQAATMNGRGSHKGSKPANFHARFSSSKSGALISSGTRWFRPVGYIVRLPLSYGTRACPSRVLIECRGRPPTFTRSSVAWADRRRARARPPDQRAAARTRPPTRR